MRDPNLTAISFKVPKTLRERIEKAAAAEERTISNYLRILLEKTIPKKRK